MQPTEADAVAHLRGAGLPPTPSAIRFHPNCPPWLVEAYSALGVRSTGPTNAFVLSITDRCNIRCDFCCHPFQNTELTEDDCIRMVLEACELQFDEICVTGGEPYLRRPLVYKLASLCRNRRRLFGSITNGYWAKDRGRAFELAAEMIESGIARVTFSWDPSHGEFVQAATIQNGLDACVNAGMKVTLTGSFKEKGDDHRRYGIDISGHAQYDTFHAIASYIAPAGWGKSLTNLYRDPVAPEEAAGFRCPGCVRNELVIYAQDGLVQPCCSVHAGYDMPNLRIGDWRKQSVADLWDAQRGDAFYRVISDGGFSLLYRIVEERDHQVYVRLPRPEATWSSCHLCELLMNAPFANRLRELCDEYVKEKLILWVYDNSEVLNRGLAVDPSES